jgi:DNA repair photolyase
MNYWDLRKEVSKIIGRQHQLFPIVDKVNAIKEKGRKRNYQQYDLVQGQWNKIQRLLNTQEVRSFAEISLRAAACPMPLNLDVWDGLLCGFGCKYCYADAFRASLYTSFFDNSKSIGMRHCSPDYYKKELDQLLKYRGEKPAGSDLRRAVSVGIPMRFGIRFEDFLPIEGKKHISLQLMQYLAEANYPIMINTKSDLIAEDGYIKAMVENKGKAAVHITLISSDDLLLKKLEPGAPNYARRVKAMKKLCDAGIRVVARIEPYMVFLNDAPERVQQYLEEVWEAGVRHITFDTYSYSANNPGIRRNFQLSGYDYDRTFLLTTDSQPIGSILLSKFMDLFRDKGFKCSTFDLGNVPSNDDGVCCCEVGGWFEGVTGFNYGSAVSAIRFIQSKKGKSVGWKDYESWVWIWSLFCCLG